MERKFITVREVCELTGLSPHSVRRRVKEGVFKELPRRQRNEKMLIFRDSVIGKSETTK